MSWLRGFVFCLFSISPAMAQHTNSIGMQFAKVPEGKFYMGSEGEGESRPMRRLFTAFRYPGLSK